MTWERRAANKQTKRSQRMKSLSKNTQLLIQQTFRI